MRSVLPSLPALRIDSNGGRFGPIRWWNTYPDPITKRSRWGWCAFQGGSVRSIDQCLADLIRRLEP